VNVSKNVVFMLRLVLAALLSLVVLRPADARAADAIPQGADINPFACLGRWEIHTKDRSVAQMEKDLERLLDPLFQPEDPRTIRALKACVVGMLKSRLGHSDARKYYLMALEENPKEPGYELWAGNYWSGFRGARRPVVELAERHYYAALDKLEQLKQKRQWHPWHDVVEEWVRKRLLVLYQEDGMPLLPWKAYPQSSSGLDAPGVSAGAMFGVSKDTRPFNRRGDNNEMRVFTGEANFADSDLRAGGAPRPIGPNGDPITGLTDLEIWEIARAPLRWEFDGKVRVRQRHFGALDVRFFDANAYESQIISGYYPTQNPTTGERPHFGDVHVREYSLGYERVFPLYPLVDFRLAGSASLGERKGVVEFLTEKQETYKLYQLMPAISRFISSDKVTLEATWAKMVMDEQGTGPTVDRLREKVIRAVELEYAFYSPMVLPRVGMASLRPYRTPTRGIYLFAGAMQDDEVYGSHTTTKQDFYGGFQFRGPGKFDYTLQGTYLTAGSQFADPNNGQVYTEAGQSFTGWRTSTYLETRLIDSDALPGLNGDVLAPDMWTLVFPISHDLALNGRDSYQNIRGGVQTWFKFFGTGFGGPAFLLTAGYDYQYFYKIEKSMHLVSANIRMGWGEL
jgi:hypothetical protein